MACSLPCRARKWVFLSAATIFSAPALDVRAGGSVGEGAPSAAIRVESAEVIVPVVVLDRRHSHLEGATLFEDDQQITDLAATDFHIFQDGIEQPIRSVGLDLPRVRRVRDNVAQHVEDSFTPRGSWASPDLPVESGYALSPLPTYLVAYTPPPSSEGSCHHIKVQVSRRHATVYARDSYCNTQQPLLDPLAGTQLGQRMTDFLNSAAEGTFHVAAQATPLLSDNEGDSRVAVAIDFPWEAVKRTWRHVNLYASVSVLGVVYDQAGNVVTRFSDTASTAQWNYYRGPLPPDRQLLAQWERAGIPSHYQTQVDLTPGEYTLRVAISDGEKFGRTDIPVKVEPLQVKNLALSGVVLCKRFQAVGEGAQAAIRAPQYVPLITNGLEFVPVGEKRFTNSERLLSYFEVYAPQASVARNLRLQMRITDPKTGEVKIEAPPRNLSLEMHPQEIAIPLATEIAIANLPAGNYRVNVQISDDSGKTSGWRTACFSVDR